MNPVHLETLLAIVDEGSFEDASAVLGISPSAVSQRIKALESQAGRVLLRRANPVTATHAGEILVQAARRIALVQAETDARLRDRMARVPLEVAVNSDSLSTWFTPVIWDMARQGMAALRIRIEDEARTLSMLRRGDVLGAVTREAKAVSGCESTYLGTVSYWAVASPELAGRYSLEEPVATGAARGVDWHSIPAIMYGPYDQVLADAMSERLIDSVHMRNRTSSIPSSDGYLEAVRAGLGWGLVIEQQARDLLESGELVQLDDRRLDIPLYWQRWRLESQLLEDLTHSVQAAAAQALAPGA